MKNHYHLTDLEAAINYWRNLSPAQGEELTLCAQAAALAEPYALMIYESRHEISAQALSAKAREAMEAWEAALSK